MRFKNFDLNLLVVLDALLTEQNITKAGEKVFISQSTTSGALARLREYFDDDLLVKVGRNMVRTPLADSLAGPVKDLLILTKATLEISPTFEPSKSDRSFTFIMSDYVATMLMPKVIQKASELAPNIKFVFSSPQDDPGANLESGDADFILMPRKHLNNEHPIIDIFDDNFVCVCHSKNTSIGDTITKEQYFDLGHVVSRFGPLGVTVSDVWHDEHYNKLRKEEVVVNNFSVMPYYLIDTNRISLVCSRLAKLWKEKLPIKSIPMPIKTPSITWSLQWHTHRSIDPATIWVRDLIKSVANSQN